MPFKSRSICSKKILFNIAQLLDFLHRNWQKNIEISDISLSIKINIERLVNHIIAHRLNWKTAKIIYNGNKI